ncbi:MAG: hypothetical protein O2962_03100 [Cyanobacteria bacterium]|nr:hypothetical protein [Cyanobacteriota bacterium]
MITKPSLYGFVLMRINNRKTSKKNDKGFTLVFALILCIIFSTLLYSSYYLLGINTKFAARDIFKAQSIYLAESGNNRALASLNVKTLPDIDEEEDDDENDDDDFDEFDDQLDALLGADGDDDFFDDEELDNFFDDEELDDLDFDEGDEEYEFLTKIPRYTNFYLKEPFYVNIDSGAKVTEATYYSLIAEQNIRLQAQRAQNPEITDRTEIPIQEIYFPLPEVNVQKIGIINIAKGQHLKPGFRVVLAERSTINLKQKDIVDEYLNYVPPFNELKLRPVVRGISPNYAYADEFLDIYIDGDNLQNIFPEISSSDISLMEYSDGLISVDINPKAKPGRYIIKIGPSKSEFYIVPTNSEGRSPQIGDIRLKEERDGNQQFVKMFSQDTLDITITGEDLSDGKTPPIIVPDASGITVDILSYTRNKIEAKVTTTKAIAGSHFLTIHTTGGASGSWIFNIEKTISELAIDPFTGSYSTVLTLLEVNSLSNLTLKSDVASNPSGRPQANGGASRPSSGGGSGRPGGQTTTSLKNKKFDLLRSDLETVWKAETIATVNKINYNETKILRRSAPRANAALVTNTEISFSQSSLIIEGLLQASTFLEESSTSEDTVIQVEGEDPNDVNIFDSRSELNQTPLVPTGKAVIENLGLGKKLNNPEGKGFSSGGIIAINSSKTGSNFSDYAIVKSSGSNTIEVTEPGFKNGHFTGDEVVQFIPALISPEELNDREAARSLNPPGAFVNITGQTNFEYVFRTRLERIEEWSDAKTKNTQVPEDFDLDTEGYFGLNIIDGTPDYTGSNALYGQGALIIDTTEGGFNPSGGTVQIGGSSKLPSIFDGVIYIIGKLQITGPTEITGAIIVNSPTDGGTTRIGGTGNISFNQNSINKAILGLPFTAEPRSRRLSKSGGQDEILKRDKQ